MDYGDPETLDIRLRPDGVLSIALDRTEHGNAFDGVLIEELNAAFTRASTDDAVRAVLLSGKGKHFSAGADITWMRAQGELGVEENRRGALRMAEMFLAVHGCKKPVVASVHGAALGGGTGLACAADVVLAAQGATFGFTEVRLGIVPAVISPLVVAKLGLARARALFLLGSRFDGRDAERHGLALKAVPIDRLEAETERCLAEVLKGGPRALAAAKELCARYEPLPPTELWPELARLIADLRTSPEAQEGLAAFLEKRAPAWTSEA